MIELLRARLQENVTIETIDLLHFRGSKMDAPTFYGVLTSELIGENFEYIIVLRDLDVSKDKNVTQKMQLKKRDKWFEKVNKAIGAVGVKGIFFLIIYELEALILCDEATINAYFNLNLTLEIEPIEEKQPKELLQKLTLHSTKGLYVEKEAKAIFKQISFQKVYQNHTGLRSFQAFVDDLQRIELISI
jgi:hypothetical protein